MGDPEKVPKIWTRRSEMWRLPIWKTDYHERQGPSLNKRSELNNSCRHRSRQKLARVKVAKLMLYWGLTFADLKWYFRVYIPSLYDVLCSSASWLTFTFPSSFFFFSIFLYYVHFLFNKDLFSLLDRWHLHGSVCRYDNTGVNFLPPLLWFIFFNHFHIEEMFVFRAQNVSILRIKI